ASPDHGPELCYWKRLVQRKPQGRSLGEVLIESFGTALRIDRDVLLLGREVDQARLQRARLAAVLVERYAVAHLLRGVGRLRPDRGPQLSQLRLDALGRRFDVRVDVIRRLFHISPSAGATVMWPRPSGYFFLDEVT